MRNPNYFHIPGSKVFHKIRVRPYQYYASYCGIMVDRIEVLTVREMSEVSKGYRECKNCLRSS